MTTQERDDMYQQFPFLELYVPKRLGLRGTMEEVPGYLDSIYSDPHNPGRQWQNRTIRLLDKNGIERGRVGMRETFHPPLRIFKWKFGGGTKTKAFRETVAEAIRRTPTPIYFLLFTYAHGSTFRLFTTPEGKTIAERAAEKNHNESIPELLSKAQARAEAVEKRKGQALGAEETGTWLETDRPYEVP